MDRFPACFLVFFVAFICDVSASAELDTSEIYTGRHLNDVVLEAAESETRLIRGAVLLVYSDPCADQVFAIYGLNGLPPPDYVMIGNHNPETAQKYIWYDLDELDDLAHRYPHEDGNCAHALLFPHGSDIRHPEVVAFNDLTMRGLWSLIKTTVMIVNRAEEDIVIKFSGSGPSLEKLMIPVGGEVEATVYRSYLLAAFRKRDSTFLQGFRLDNKFFDLATEGNNIPIVSVSDSASETSYTNWVTQEQRHEDEATDTFINWMTYITLSYLMSFKLPMFVPKFDRNLLGYKKTKIPDEAFAILKNFYETEGPKINQSGTVGEGTPINIKHTMITEEPMTDEIGKQISDLILPTIEEFFNCPLQQTIMFGIREYHRGNHIRFHTDGASDTAIVVILQVAQDVNSDDSPWPLQIIDFSGKRRNVTLQVGEMVMLESASVIHGRPYPFQGNTYANFLLCYAPRQGWNWKFTEEWHVTNGTFSESVMTFVTENMDQINDRNWNFNYLFHDLSPVTHAEL